MKKSVCKTLFLSGVLAVGFAWKAAFAGEVPHEVAGIELGENISEYEALESSSYLGEKIIMDWKGFRKGIISFGTCDSPGVIVKLRMKYADTSETFFNTLLEKYTARFGKPELWKGDPFGIKHIWKWKFEDSAGRQVNMILQHNLEDDDVSLGNQVKLYYPDLIRKEHLCFLREREEAIHSTAEPDHDEQSAGSSWKNLIPR